MASGWLIAAGQCQSAATRAKAANRAKVNALHLCQAFPMHPPDLAHLTYELKGHVGVVTLNRPEVRNAFNDELISELTGLFSGLDSSVRVVTL
ncbi:MAG: hypothetical protein ABL996_22565, partial [Micropepsaceae bacterium]